MRIRFSALLACLVCLLTLGPVQLLAADSGDTVSLGKMQVAPKAPVGDSNKKRNKIQRVKINASEFSVKAPGAGAIGGLKMGPMQIAKPSASSADQAADTDQGGSSQPTAQAAPAKPKPAPAVQHGPGRVQNIVPIRMDPPDYPREAAIAHKTGSVTVQFTVEADGTTSNVHVLQAHPRKLFNKAAIRAVMRWRFRPYAVDGKPQARKVEQTIVFDLNKR